MRILINVPDYRHIHGGVTNHYIGLKPYWKEDVRYNIIGKRREGWSGMWWLPWDYLKFVFLLLFSRPDIVLVNPSMNAKAWPRDRMFVRLARLCRRKVAVMFHGWSQNYFSAPSEQKRIIGMLNKCSCVFVLAGDFKKELLKAGIKVPVYLTTTKVPDDMFAGYDVSVRSGKVSRILFLARVVEAKGIFILLEAFKKLLDRYSDMSLTIAGDGEDFDKVSRYISDNRLINTTMMGHVKPSEIGGLFKEHDIYVLPTYGEGMPTSVLEAMAFGLPVVTRPVGGLKDFFEDGKMGALTDSLSPGVYSDIIMSMRDNPQIVKEMSRYNADYARRRFKASIVASEMEKKLSML